MDQRLLVIARFGRNVASYRRNLAIFERRYRLAAARDLMKGYAGRIMGVRRLLISMRIDEGRLPNTVPPFVSGQPGFGSDCDACDGYLPPTRFMIMIPHGDTFAYIHSDCHVIWAAQCRLRAALRGIA